MITARIAAIVFIAVSTLQITPASAATIAQRYSPLVYFHPDESYWPSSVGRTLGHSDLKWARNGRTDPTVDASIDSSRLGQATGRPYKWTEDGREYRAAQCTRPHGGCSPRASGLENREGFYIEMNNDYRAGIRSTSSDPDVYRGAPLYFEYVPLRAGGHALTYWFFYEYNRKTPVTHEGEWEHISIKLNADGRPEKVAYFQHHCAPVIKSWSATPKSGTHPKVYVAVDGHASYWSAGRHEICSVPSWVPGGSWDDDTTSGNGRRWKTEDATHVNVRAASWYGFGGAWGTPGERTEWTGPLGPGPLKDPSPWTER